MKDGPGRKKLLSKLQRLRIRDDIACFLRNSPSLRDLEETQTGNHVYSGSGRIKIGTSYADVTLRIRMVRGLTMLYLAAPRAGISVACPFDPKGSAAAVREAVRKSLN